MDKKTVAQLRQLAKIYGIQTSYYDVFKQRHTTAADVTFAVLNSLNPQVESIASINDVLREETLKYWNNFVQPITLVWKGKEPHLLLHLERQYENANVGFSFYFEDGSDLIWHTSLKNIPAHEEHLVEGRQYLIKSLPLPIHIPLGYHQLTAELSDTTYHSKIISAPQHAYYEKNVRRWGLFTPLYALHSNSDFGAGDFNNFNQLIEWVSSKQGNMVGTLPLFAAFLDQQSIEPSPYSPISRLFYNEFYLDVRSIPEFQGNSESQKIFNSPGFNQQVQRLREDELVNYQEIMTLKRKLIEPLSRDFFSKTTQSRATEFQEFLQKNPYAESYAAFRAVHEKVNMPWSKWDTRLRDGVISASDYDENVRNYYLYSQWQTTQQLAEVFQNAQRLNVDLYLDIPLGVHSDGFDTWLERDLFARDLSVGAPPDALSSGGQNWGFPPMIPQKLRESGYQYYINSLKTVLPFVNLLRLDHVMGLHRLYCIPDGFEANDGAFIRYPGEELNAILCLESQRNKACIVGENLGTVPGYVNRAMQKHHLYKMFVMEYELNSEQEISHKDIPLHSVTSINTHDMAPFAAFAQGLDIEGMNNPEKAWGRRKSINPQRINNMSKLKLNRIWLKWLDILSKSRSQFLLVNLEDLFFETKPQNVPNSKNNPNWHRKTKLSFEEWSHDVRLCAKIKRIALGREKALKKRQKK